MATSLFRLGRLESLKYLLRANWGTQRTQFGAALCTKADAPPRTPKKAKAASKTIEANERASLLAYKPAVTFPSKLSATGFLPKDIALGESESSAKIVTSETVVAAEQPNSSSQSVTEAKQELPKETEAAEAVSTSNVDGMTTNGNDTASEIQPAGSFVTKSEEIKTSDVEAEVQKDQDTSSSSSSDSDSDSDSDSEEKPEKEPKTETVVKSEGKAAEDKEASVPTSKQVNKLDSESVILPRKSQKEGDSKVKPEGVVTPKTEAVGSEESHFDPAPILSSSPKVVPEVTSESITALSPEEIVVTATGVKTAPAKNIVENISETKAKAAPDKAQEPIHDKTSRGPLVLEVTTETSLKEVANATVGVVTKAHKDVVNEAFQEIVGKHECEAAAETVAKAGVTGVETSPSEDLKDSAPVVADAVETLAETEVVETYEEQAPEKATEPEPEPFDNTTYKNLQHHHYNMYTFVDMDVQMSKHRLPQPSSGRPSPMH